MTKNKFKELPRWKQGIVASIGFIVFILTMVVFFEVPWTSFWKYIMLFLFMPIYSLCAMPIMTYAGMADFKSELLFITKHGDKVYEIHYGSLFDILMSGLFTGKRGSFRNLMMFFLVDGLVGIVEDIESGNILPDAEIYGTSYFFNVKTAEKMGFGQAKTKTSHKYILMANVVEMMIVLSSSKGKLSIPEYSKFKTVRATGNSLLENKERIYKYHSYLKSKINL